MKLVLSSIVIAFSLFCSAQNTLVHFEKNSAELNTEAISILDSIIDVLHSQEIRSDILLTGHTDMDASDEFNQTLSLKRTRSVHTYFTENGVSNRFHLISKGETDTINSNLTETEMALNRRVEINLDYQTNRTVFDQFQQKAQVFRISPFEETTITTAAGVRLTFGKEIFEDVKEYLSVRINIQEFLNKEDFLLANLTTSTVSNELLESGGMINIVPTQGEDTLRLKPGKSFDILFPNRATGDEMQLFQGIDHGGDELWNQTTFTPSRLSQRYSWFKLYYPDLTDEEREFFKHELIDGDTIEKSRTWGELINGKSFELTEVIDIQGTRLDTVPMENLKLLDELLQTSTTLGWINCDRFYDSNTPKETLYVQFEGDFIPTVSLVIDDINSVLRYSYREDNMLVFTSVPVGMNVTIIGLHKEDNSENILFAKRKSRTRKDLKEQIQFQPTSSENIRASLSSL